jgi:hemerythrin-like domain-containing protein
MNTATKNLENDHVHILRLIDIMEVITQKEEPDIQHLEQIVEMIKSYADGFHHAKEENLFFPLLATKGFSKEQGPIAVMLHEHVQGRIFVKGMSENIEKYKKGDKNALGIIYTNMRGYIALLRNHILKENNVLFKMADNILTEDDHQNLLKQFEKVENSKLCGGVLNDCVQQIETLAKVYNL